MDVNDVIAPIAIIPGQPLTYLTVAQEDRIREIMRIKTNKLWESTFYSDLRRNLAGRRKLLREGYLQLSGNDLKIVRKAGIELMGDELFDLYIKDEDISN